MEKDNSTSNAPDWISTDFLAKVLARDCKENEIMSWEIERATKPGDNYGSDIYRINLQLKYDDKIETKSLIVKVEVTSELSQFTSEGNVFGKEVHAYTAVIPKIYKMLQEVLRNKFQPFVPHCYYTHLGPPGSVLVFEDLKEESFRLAERSVGLDMKHSLLVIRTLARYHASSVVLHQEQPDLFEPLMSSVYRKSNVDTLKTLTISVLTDLAEEVNKWPGYEGFPDKLRKIAEESNEILLEGVTANEGDFNVLAHEDLWLNNIMFKYSEDTGEVVDLRLLDFQACQWISPAVDIQRYLQSTPTVEILEQHEYILEEYFKVLRDTLEALGHLHLCPTMDHLRGQMHRRAKFGFVLGIITRAFFLADPDAIPEIDKVLRNESRVKFGKMFIEVVRKLLPALDKNNWI